MVGNETRYRAFLETLGQDRLKRTLTPVAARDARTLTVGGRAYVNFASNDYLALRFHKVLIARAQDWAEAHGTGSGASRLVTGHLDLFEALEDKVARLKDKPAALLMASGFQANAAVLQALFDRTVLGAEPLVFADRLNHASMHFGCKAGGVRQLRYRHGDASHLAELLTPYQGDSRPKFILTESVFSMDGDIAPLAEISALAKTHDAMLIVDDAHATGILGDGGAGLSGGADLIVGTFSKALGSFGAYVACSDTMRDYLVNRCSGFIYSTALPPPVLGAIDAALDLLPNLDDARTHVAALAAAFRKGAHARGYDTGESVTQIVPVIVGSADAALGLSARLREAGFWATAIRPPTVPQGLARVRFAFTAAHTEEDVDALLAALGAPASQERTKAEFA
ncbi:MAG: aminotransferase class I/II-fold pyridoxal phosphate-dependent enzyme [Methyloceanibacter sp.]|jgi:8-amino-7-oxononanoate synthase|uniref:aminotransferase class I/II-fold pyridoxal phosphate-dependent enzyme n=1 Tax=Methyloceanibacter sp. TaxID=1965321 RepID=UPI003565B9AB